ncbi:MAG: isoprenylcysteine carboxylmethyltransferase family protein [Candidatus Korobacteraceae bacterium]|jgi:protein-S-isoprenylcysteine O-methyltransferase Ste14
MVHPFAGFWRKRPRGLPLIGIVWIALWVLAWLVSSPWRLVVLYQTGWSWVLAAPFWAVAIFVEGAGVRGLRFWRIIGRPELNPSRRDNQLVTTGIQGRVRHPLYLGHLCIMLGWDIGTGSLACWSLTAFAVVAGAAMIRAEERELEQRFGAAYREYKRRVPVIVPRWK